MKKILFTTMVAFIATSSHAQLTIGKSAGQAITEQAINGSVVIVKQSYQVKDKKTGKVYGQNGRKDFGHNYSIGVKTEAGLVLTDGALKPWFFDNDFKKVEDKFEPIISLTEARDVEANGNDTFTQCPLHIGRQQPDGLWIADAGTVAPNAMEIDNANGDKDGWLIWFVAKKSLDETPNAKISTQILNTKMAVSGGDLEIETPTGGDAVLGGIYVCPAYLGGGHVVYRLVGMTVKSDGKWLLRTPFLDMELEHDSSEDVGEQQPNASQEDEDVDLTPIDTPKKPKSKK